MKSLQVLKNGERTPWGTKLYKRHNPQLTYAVLKGEEEFRHRHHRRKTVCENFIEWKKKEVKAEELKKKKKKEDMKLEMLRLK